MKIKTITNIEHGVNVRFFEAIEALVLLDKISSLSGFCLDHGLSPAKYREMRFSFGVAPRTDVQSRYVSVNIECLYYLVVDFGVSSDWLLTGKGGMFVK